MEAFVGDFTVLSNHEHRAGLHATFRASLIHRAQRFGSEVAHEAEWEMHLFRPGDMRFDRVDRGREESDVTVSNSLLYSSRKRVSSIVPVRPVSWVERQHHHSAAHLGSTNGVALILPNHPTCREIGSIAPDRRCRCMLDRRRGHRNDRLSPNPR